MTGAADASAAPDASDIATLGLLRVGGDLIGIEARHLGEVAPIGRLDRILTAQPSALGTVTVRGSLIPVCDPMILCGCASNGTTPSIAAVVTDRDSVFALGVDGIEGLRRCRRDDIQSVDGRATMLLDGETVHILDAAELLSRADVPRARYRLRRRRGDSAEFAPPHLTFSAGGAAFALQATCIFGSVPRRQIDDRALATGAFLGLIDHFGRRIPVVDTCRATGFGTGVKDNEPEIVVVRLTDDQLLGLAVDKIRRIEHFEAGRIDAFPERFRRHAPLIGATAQTSAGTIFVLDHTAMQGDDALVAVSEMSLKTETLREDDAAAGHETVPGDVIRERLRSLIFTAGQELATPMTQIVRIIAPPDALTPCRSGVSGQRGLFFCDGTMTPLVALSEFLGLRPSAGGGPERVLLVGDDDRRVGFLVDHVDGIAMSNWRSQPEARMPGGFDLVELRQQGRRRVTNHIDLAQTAAAVFDG